MCFSKNPPKDSPFAAIDNAILTPHIGGSTAEAQEAVGEQIALQVREYLKLGVVQNAVNLPSVSQDEYLELAPFIDVGRAARVVSGASSEKEASKIGSTYHGRLGEWKTELIRNARSPECLDIAEEANRMNAGAVRAAERGIRVHEGTRKPKAPWAASGRVLSIPSKHRGGFERRGRGAARRGAAVAAAGRNRFEAPLEGKLMSIRNIDVPGVIGRVGTILGRTR